MTMHLAHPALSLAGKKKGRQKFRSAQHAQQARELEASWEALKQRWGVSKHTRTKRNSVAMVITAPAPTLRDQDSRPNSLNSWVTGAVSSKPNQHYTGTKIKGIGTMHKSNAVPVFSDQEAQDIAKMRRN